MLSVPRLQFIYSTKPMYTIITIICSQALCSSCILLLTLIITGLICLAKEANTEKKTVEQVARKRILHKQYQSCRFRLSIMWKDVRIWKVSFIFCTDFFNKWIFILLTAYFRKFPTQNSLFADNQLDNHIFLLQKESWFHAMEAIF